MLCESATRIMVVAVEILDAPQSAELERTTQGSARLLLTAPRLQRVGRTGSTCGAIELPTIDLARVRALASAPNAQIDAPVAALTPIELGALELLRLSFVLPAAIVASVADTKVRQSGMASVALSNVMAFRAARVRSLRIVARAPVPLDGAPQTEFVVFRGGEGMRDQVAVIIGEPDFAGPVTVRLHSACLTGDLFGSLKCDCGDQLRGTARMMAESGGGVLLYIDQEGRGNGLSNKIHAYALQAQGYDTFDADEILGFDQDQRRFDFAAEMLKKLGVSRVRVMTNNPAKIAALGAAGIEVASDLRIFGRKTDHNLRYLAAKRERAGHLLHHDF